MRTVPLPLVGGAYADESRPWSMQDTVNYLPTMTEREGTRTPSMLKTPPGLKPYQAGSEGTVRGTYEAEGRMFAVIGSALYQVSNAGVLILLGTVPGFTRVQFTHNQISLGNEIVVVNGSAGYVYNTVTATFARITDEGYPGSSVAAFIDGMVLGIEPQGRYAFNSAPAQATQYNTLDRFTSEFKPDRLVALGVSNNELLLLSAGSGEFFENTGASEQPFRSKRITMDKGAAGPHVVVGLDNTLLWLGSDGSFYALEGYSPRRISTRPIEQAIAGLNWTQAFGFVWKDKGYEVAYWTFPDGRTWGYDAANREWHRRESDDLHRWRANTMTRWNGKWYAGDYNGPRLYEVDWDYPYEWDNEFASERTCAVMHDDQNRAKCPRLELVMDTGQPLVQPISGFPAQPLGPTITGAAPNGNVDEAYTYTYTTTAGSSAIVKTTIDETALLPGLTWNQDTATISGTPTQIGSMTITPRVVDLNGLWDELTDTIAIIDPSLLAAWEPMTMPDSMVATLSEDNRIFSSTGNVVGAIFSTVPIRQKSYFEIQLDTDGGIAYAGIAMGEFNRRTALNLGVAWADAGGGAAVAALCNSGDVLSDGDTVGTLSGGVGDSMRVRFAVDPDTRKVWIGAVGMTGWLGGGNPSTGTLPTVTLPSGGLMWAAASLVDEGDAVLFSAELISNAVDFTGDIPSGFAAGLYEIDPEGTYTTLWPDNTHPAYSLTNGNLTATGSGSVPTAIFTTSRRIKRTGKAYWEVKCKSGVNDQPRAIWGISHEGSDYYKFNNAPLLLRGYGLASDGDAYIGNADSFPLTAGVNTDDILRFKFDIDGGKLEVAINGGSFGTIADDIDGPGWRVSMSTYEGDFLPEGGTFNFGATAFVYAVPSGYGSGWLEDGT